MTYPAPGTNLSTRVPLAIAVEIVTRKKFFPFWSAK